jgi:hypothetical protein
VFSNLGSNCAAAQCFFQTLEKSDGFIDGGVSRINESAAFAGGAFAAADADDAAFAHEDLEHAIHGGRFHVKVEREFGYGGGTAFFKPEGNLTEHYRTLIFAADSLERM